MPFQPIGPSAERRIAVGSAVVVSPVLWSYFPRWIVGAVLRLAEMPFKSKAQRRKFAELLVTGKISDETYEEWNREPGKATLPERVTPKAGAKSRKKGKPAPKSKSSRKTK